MGCKVIRDLNKLGQNGVGDSKGYAFVSFAAHEDALEALRSMNNNPGIFTKDKRPIVEFSIENKKAVNLRIKRMEKSREKNPNFKAKNVKSNEQGHKKADKKPDHENKLNFSGAISDPKQKGLPTHSGPKVRHKKISRKALRKQEQDMKDPKKRKRALEEREREAEKMPEPETKKRKKEKKRKKPKKISKEQRKDLVEDKNF